MCSSGYVPLNKVGEWTIEGNRTEELKSIFRGIGLTKKFLRNGFYGEGVDVKYSVKIHTPEEMGLGRTEITSIVLKGNNIQYHGRRIFPEQMSKVIDDFVRKLEADGYQ